MTDEQLIRDVIDTWFTASRTGDLAKVLTLMSDDVVFLVPGRPAMRGKAAFAAASEGAAAAFDIDGSSEIQEIQVAGDWAYVWSELSVRMTPRTGGQASERRGPTLSIFRKEEGRWVLARDANMLARIDSGL
jgi:uncharacterized protein (TIGR02246 family)